VNMPSDNSGLNLSALTPEEMQELDTAITPRVAMLLSKVYPPASQILQPFIVNDAGEPSQIPSTKTPVNFPTSALGGVQNPVR
jgi:hypothetical protein